MIVEAFKDSLELGLEKHGQIVVSIGFSAIRLGQFGGRLDCTALMI